MFVRRLIAAVYVKDPDTREELGSVFKRILPRAGMTRD